MRKKDNYNEYMKIYMLERYRQRRDKAIEKLGGKCIKCESIEKLEFDHIDRSTKKFGIGKMSSVSEEKFWIEIAKCQLLCKSCHQLKTLEDLGQQNAKTTHGTVSSYRYCKCDLCKEAWNKFSREWKRKKKLQANSL